MIGQSNIPTNLSPHTQALVALCQGLGWVVNMEKLELKTSQIFDFVGYQYDLREDKVRPFLERWTLNMKIRELLDTPFCWVRQLMLLKGMLTATEMHVHLGQLHMKPIQWHLKNQLNTLESLERVISVPKSIHS